MKSSIRLLLIASGFLATTCASPLSAGERERQGTTVVPSDPYVEAFPSSALAKAGEQQKESTASYFQRLDEDCNRRITLSEYTARRPGKKICKARIAVLFSALDLDKNGDLTPEEFARSRARSV